MTAVSDMDIGIAELREKLRRGETSSEELVTSQLSRAESLSELNAFITLATEQALDDARKADAATTEGRSLGRLHGIPITLKDLVWSNGVRTSSGSKVSGDFVPDRDATVWARLRAEGAILLAKTNMHEFAYGVSNVNPHYGPARNPWNPDRMSGGSSGGSAVALAAGLGWGSIGTDTGGSIRIPSSLCGTVGLKPTYGRVSRFGVTPLSWSLDHVGPMTRRVRDAALLYEVIAGPDPEDATALQEPVEPVSTKLERFDGIADGLRLGIHRRYFFDQLAPETASAVEKAIGELTDLGMKPVEIDIPEIEAQAACRNTIAFAEAASYHEDDLRQRPELYGKDTLELLRLGLLIPATDYLAAMRARGPIIRAFRAAFAKIDVLVTPATPAAAPPIGATELETGEELRSGLLRLASPFNTTGFPALSLPCGLTNDGRPIGLQLAASPLHERLLLEVGYAYERLHDWWKAHPQPPAPE